MEVCFVLKRYVCWEQRLPPGSRTKFVVKNLYISSVALPWRCSSKPKNVFVVVPGNPGLSGFYETLMILLWRGLSDTSDTAIWCVSHAGHDTRADPPINQENEDVYSLEGKNVWTSKISVLNSTSVFAFQVKLSINMPSSKRLGYHQMFG